MRFDRLRQIAEDVRRVPDGCFDMRVYRCGMRGCALGWHAFFHPESGIRFYPQVGDEGIEYAGYMGCEAAAAYCEIDILQAVDLFGSHAKNRAHHDDKDYVVERIEQFIKDNEPQPVIEMKAEAAREAVRS